jgi:hypothetical protein
MAEGNFKYDVGFSFLAKDEVLAIQIGHLLEDRFSVFIYSEQQKELAGRDGETVLNRVFAKEARVVVVLYRQGWGETPWTRIEMTAIKNRAYNAGYDFTFFIPLDEPPVTPEWLPKTHMWLNLNRFGVGGAAEAIESKLVASGAIPSVQSAVDLARKLKADELRHTLRNSFLRSNEGVAAARAELHALFVKIDEFIREINAPDADGEISSLYIEGGSPILPDGPYRGRYTLQGLTLVVAWSQQFANSLEYSALQITLWRGSPEARGNKPLRKKRYNAELSESERLAWREANGDSRFYTSQEMADLAMKLLLEEYKKKAIQ